MVLRLGPKVGRANFVFFGDRSSIGVDAKSKDKRQATRYIEGEVAPIAGRGFAGETLQLTILENRRLPPAGALRT